MRPTYYVILRIKAKDDFDSFGRFYFGHDRDLAENVFTQMHQTSEMDGTVPIQLDFMEMVNGIPATLHIIGCTLDQLSMNVKIMAREAFKHLNLHDQ